MNDTKIEIITELKKILDNAVNNKERYCKNDKAFTRSRVLTFSITCLLGLPVLS